MNKEIKLPKRAQKIDKITTSIEKILSSYGYNEVYLPLYEYYDILSKTVWNFSDENIIRFIDRNTGKSMVLRPDFTPQVCRNVANYWPAYPNPIRLCYKGRIFRNVNINKGLKSEMHQIGLELFGEEELYGDLEILLIGYKGLTTLNISDFKIVLSDGLFLGECLNLLKEKEQYIELLRSKRYYEIASIVKMLNLEQEKIDLFSTLPHSFGGIEVVDELINRVSFSSTLVNRLKELQKLYNNLLDLGIQKDKLIFDLGETTGLNYYTGLKFSFINKNTGGSLISGGRYDNLMEKFGLKLSACGIAFNIEEILSLYETEDEKIGIDYLVVGKNNFKKAEEFRKKGFKVLWVSDNDKIENLELLYQIKNIIS